MCPFVVRSCPVQRSSARYREGWHGASRTARGVTVATIGERIRELRDGWMSQQELAAAAGVSVELVRKLEQGQRHTATVASLQKIADALDTDVAYLFAKAKPPPTTEPNSGIVAIRRALTSVDDLAGFDGDAGEVVSLADAERTVTYLWGARWSGRYELLSSAMANAIGQLRATYQEASASDKHRAAHLLARTYSLAGVLLVTVSQTDLAFIENREALKVAKNGDNELVFATLHMSLATQLKAQGRHDEATGLCLKAAERISPRGDVPDSHLAAYGLLVVTAAMSAARKSDNGFYADVLAESGEVARRIGYERDDHDTTFGPVKVSMIATTLAVERQDYAETLRVASRISGESDLPTASRVALLSNVALAHLRSGKYQRFLDTLLFVESVSFECVKYH